jgi:predicted CDP-diglyceride synthetase/phosphatidate cytidylyltransferase
LLGTVRDTALLLFFVTVPHMGDVLQYVWRKTIERKPIVAIGSML